MKHFFILAAALIVTQAQAGCEERIQQQFEALRASAQLMYPMVEKLQTTSASFQPIAKSRNAEMNYQANTISINQDICQYQEIYAKSIVAHEIGHFIATFIYGNTKDDEMLADYYGAKLLALEERQPLLEFFEKGCEKATGFCVKYANWQNGMIR